MQNAKCASILRFAFRPAMTFTDSHWHLMMGDAKMGISVLAESTG
jgi:hypothetical protein